MRSIPLVAVNLRVMRNVLPRRSGQKGRVTKKHGTERNRAIVRMTVPTEGCRKAERVLVRE
jgi:hypothetical protein